MPRRHSAATSLFLGASLALAPGRYVVRLRARAVDGGAAAGSVAQAIFTIAPPTKETP